MSEQKYFDCPTDAVFNKLLIATEEWLSNDGFACQRLSTEAGDVLIQIEKEGKWKKLIGMDTALNIVFTRTEATLEVEIGAGKWVDKAISGTVGLVIFAPLAITAGIGAWQQAKMPEKIFTHIQTFLKYQ